MKSNRWLFAPLLPLFAFALMACSNDDQDGSGGAEVPTDTPSSESPATESPTTEADSDPTRVTDAAEFPVEVEHRFGTTTVPEEPERVIALGYNEQDAILALEVQPIATRYWFGDAPFAVFPWAQDELGSAEPEVLNMTYGELDFEAIAALEPDLISAVYSGITEEEYATLSGIAPTVAQTGDYIDFGMPWQEATVLIGESLGRASEAEDVVAAVQGEIEEVRESHPEWQGASVAIVAPRGDGQVGIFASGDLRSRFFESLGFDVPAEFDELAGESFFVNVSLERADLLDQDLVIFHQLSYLEGGREAVESDPLWSSLSALQDGRAVFLDEDLDSAFGFNSALSIEYFMDGVVPQLEEALSAND